MSLAKEHLLKIYKPRIIDNKVESIESDPALQEMIRDGWVISGEFHIKNDHDATVELAFVMTLPVDRLGGIATKIQAESSQLVDMVAQNRVDNRFRFRLAVFFGIAQAAAALLWVWLVGV